MRRVLIPLLVAAFAAAPASAADDAERLPDGSVIAGVGVGGLGPVGAERAVRDALGPVYETRPIAIRVSHRDTLVTPAQAGISIDYPLMVKRAFSSAKAGEPVDIRLVLSVSNPKLRAKVAAIAKRFYRAPRD